MAQCIICTHDERQAIDAALVAGQSLRTVAEQFGTATTTLHRHKGHLPAELAKSQQAAEVARADDLLEQMRQLQQTTRDILNRAHLENEQRIALTAVREVRGNMELLAKLMGQLQSQPIVNVLAVSSEWVDMRGRIMAALAPYPDARTAVVEAIRESGR
jgi:transposase-like protein